MFEQLELKQSHTNQTDYSHWCYKKYYSTYLTQNAVFMNQDAILLCSLDERGVQILHDALVYSVEIQVKNFVNHLDIKITFLLECYGLEVTYHAVDAYDLGFGDGRGHSMDVNIHELLYQNEMYEHRILLQGRPVQALKPLWIKCKSVSCVKNSMTIAQYLAASKSID